MSQVYSIDQKCISFDLPFSNTFNEFIMYTVYIMNVTFLTICLGLVAGLFGGSLGQSGAALMLPGLLLLGIVADYKTAAGTVLLTILPPLSLGAVFVYYKRNQVAVTTALILMVSYFIAA